MLVYGNYLCSELGIDGGDKWCHLTKKRLFIQLLTLCLREFRC